MSGAPGLTVGDLQRRATALLAPVAHPRVLCAIALPVAWFGLSEYR